MTRGSIHSSTTPRTNHERSNMSDLSRLKQEQQKRLRTLYSDPHSAGWDKKYGQAEGALTVALDVLEELTETNRNNVTIYQQEVADLRGYVQCLVDWADKNGYLEDHTFTFPNGETWEANS